MNIRYPIYEGVYRILTVYRGCRLVRIVRSSNLKKKLYAAQ